MTAAGAVVASPRAETTGPGLPARGSRFTGRAWLERFPPRPVPDTWPATELGRAGVQDLLLGPPFALGNPASQAGRKAGLSRILDWLEQQPGGTLAGPLDRQRRGRGGQRRLAAAGSPVAARDRPRMPRPAA
ncbi:MAG: hypothetical protein ACLP70_02165 [Streptosporangiaceae bacterium]